jgi:serine/threonine-protein kinase
MADVYLACTQGPRGFQKLLVVKLARFTGDPVLATMFLEEARIAAQLEHPNVVQTFEIAEEGTRHYIVMEYLDGANLSRLRQKLAKAGGIPLRTSLTILLHVLDGLEYAHEARGLDGRQLDVVHRDLSPSNIMVTAQGVVKILDFGIAKATDSYSFTQTGKFSGKLSYMPPEQMRGHTVDARADLFAFGVTLAEAAMGEKLWGSTSSAEIAAKLGNNEIPSLDRAKPIDPMLRAICERALAPDREQRYSTAAELKADLVKYIEVIGGQVTQRELAQFVKTTVEVDRAKLQTIVDSQLQKLNAQGWVSTTPIPELPRVEHTPSKDSTIQSGDPVFEEIQIIDEPGAPPRAQSLPSIPVAPRRVGPKLLALAGVLLALLILFAIVWMWPKREPVAAALPPPAPAPAALPSTVRLEVVVSPANATIALDGRPLGTNPYLGAFARDTLVHQLSISAPGYRTLTHEFAADRDLNLQLNLAVEPPAPPTPPPSRPVAITRPPVAHVAAKHPKPIVKVEAKVEAKPPPPEPAKPDPSTQKRGVDTDIYSNPSAKRSLDSNVLDGSAANKPTIDRDNPWQR